MQGDRNRSEITAWPSFKFQLDHGPNEELVANARKIIVAVDATKVFEVDALMWAFQHVVQAGDVVVLLGVIQRIRNPMGYKTQADQFCFNGTNEAILGDELGKRLQDYQQKLRDFSQLCSEKKVQLKIRVKAGYPLKLVVVLEASTLKAASVVLDRRLKNDQEFYSQFLFCDVAMMLRKDEATILKRDAELDGTRRERDADNGPQEPEEKNLNYPVPEKMNSLRRLMSMGSIAVKEPAAGPPPVKLPGDGMADCRLDFRSGLMNGSNIESEYTRRAPLPKVGTTAKTFYATTEKITEEKFSASSSSSVLVGGSGRWPQPPRRSYASFGFAEDNTVASISPPEISSSEHLLPPQIEFSNDTASSCETSPVTAAMLYGRSAPRLDDNRQRQFYSS